MRRFALGRVSIALVVSIGAAPVPPPAARVVDAVFADLTQPGSPGCALGVYRNGAIVYAKGYGLANVEEKVSITPQSVFNVGSVSKQFTAASILLLEQAGRLRLDGDVRKYVPELPDYAGRGYGSITLRQLLNHTSGLRDYVSLFLLSGVHIDNVTTDAEALGVIAHQRDLNFAPGSDWEYSNSGYVLLSHVVKRVSGKSLKDFAAENLFRPLGMAHTAFRDDHTSLVAHRALAYDRNEKGDYVLSVSYGEENGDGMVQTTLADLQKWDENFYSGRIGGRRLVDELEAPGTLNDGRTIQYAKGLFVDAYRGLRLIWHSGGSGGYRAALYRFPDQHFSLACLCNLQTVNRSKRLRALADLYLAGAVRARPESGTAAVSPEGLRALTGCYRDPKTLEVWRVELRDAKLWARYEGRPVELRPLGPLEFELEDPTIARVVFQPAQGAGRSRLMVERMLNFPATLEAVEEVRPAAPELAVYAGDYWSDELRVTYRLAIREDALWLMEVIGADGIVHAGALPSSAMHPVLRDEFDLEGGPLIFSFARDEKGGVSGFTLNGFLERGMRFVRRPVPEERP